MSKRYPAEQRERAVKMVLDHLNEYNSVYGVSPARRSDRNWASARSHSDSGHARLRSMPTTLPEQRPRSNSASRNSNARTEISRKPTRF